MKFSEEMLKGFEMVGGRQFCGGYYAPDGSDWSNPPSVCVLGAANLARRGEAGSGWYHAQCPESVQFAEVWGEYPSHLNDAGVHWLEIYGMAVAAGL